MSNLGFIIFSIIALGVFGTAVAILVRSQDATLRTEQPGNTQSRKRPSANYLGLVIIGVGLAILPNVFGLREEATLSAVLVRSGIGILVMIAGLLIRRALIKRWLALSTIAVAKVYTYTENRKRKYLIKYDSGTIERTVYFVNVRFEANGKSVQLKIKISSFLYSELHNRDSVRIRYANADPRIALLEGEGFVFGSFPSKDDTPGSR